MAGMERRGKQCWGSDAAQGQRRGGNASSQGPRGAGGSGEVGQRGAYAGLLGGEQTGVPLWSLSSPRFLPSPTHHRGRWRRASCGEGCGWEALGAGVCG